MFRKLAAALALVGIAVGGAQAQAGSVTYDFTDVFPDEYYGNNPVPWYWDGGGNPGGFLAITHPVEGQNFWMLFPDIDDGQVVTAFRLEADLRIGNSSTERPADGFSINFARVNDPFFADPTTTAAFASGLPEAGTTTGIAISFDFYQGNTLPDGPDVEGLIVRVDNETVLLHAMPTRHGECEDVTSLQTGPRDADFWAEWAGFESQGAYLPESWEGLCWARLIVELTEEGRLTVSYKGEQLLDTVLEGYFPTASRLVLAGRTGGSNSHIHVDNIELTTTAGTDTEAPTTPGTPEATFTGARRVSLTWPESVDNTGRVSYEVERDGTVISSLLLNNTFTDTGATPGTTHTYRVRALDASQNASGYATLNVTTEDEAPSTGFLVAQIYDGITGTSVQTDLLPNAKFPNDPDRVVYVPGVNTPSFGDNYGLMVSGTLTVPVTGQYHFFLRSDDASQFFLNAEGSALPVPGADFPLAQETGCCAAFVEPGVTRPDLTSATTFDPISLTAGQQYGFVVLLKEGGGGDFVQLAMRREGDPTPAAQLTPIPLPYLTGQADPTGASVTITDQPDSQTIPANSPVTFTVAAQHVSPYGAPIAYQWLRDGEVIPGATGASYTIPFVSTAHEGAEFSVWVATAGANVTSDAAVLTVGADTTAPLVTGISGSLNSVVVRFNEPISATSAQTLANYQLSGGATVASATRISGDGQVGVVRLDITGATPGETYEVTISGVQDLAGNPVAATTGSFDAYHILSNFNDGQVPAGAALVGSASVQSTGGPDGSGHLQLTAAAGSLQGTINYDDVLEGEAVESFTATFDLYIGNGSGNAADGFSFNIGSDLTPTSNVGEEGAGTGLTVGFDTYVNAGETSPSIKIKVLGTLVETIEVEKAVLVNNRWVDVAIQVDEQGALTVIHDNVLRVDNLDLTQFGWTPISGARLTLGARTGGEFAAHRIDNLQVLYNTPVTLLWFETSPAFTAGYAGDDLQVTGAVAGATGVEYQWQRLVGGEWVNVTDGAGISGAATGTLSFTGATVAQSGQYRLVGTAGDDEIASLGVEVRVLSTLQDVTSPSDTIVGVGGQSPASGNEDPEMSFDNTTTKYLNFGEGETAAPFQGPVGVTVTPAAGASVVTGIRFYTANDAEVRDPAGYILEGSNDGTTFTEIASGALSLPARRNPAGQEINPLTHALQEVLFSNSTAYTTYRLMFENVKNNATANSMQIGEIELLGTTDGGPTGPTVDISRDGEGNITISYEGQLQSAESVEGPYTNVEGAGNPYTVAPEGEMRFFRAVN